LPIICKLLEHIARTNFRTILTEKQSPLQRGFTTNISPLNAAIIIEEVYREYSDKKAPFYIALLDAKSAFDVVVIILPVSPPVGNQMSLILVAST
jgi:hypothetical protein